MTIQRIKVDGLRDFQAALKNMDGESQKQLRLVLNESAEIVASGARRLVPSRSGRARSSIKTASSQREVRIKAGGAKASYYAWLDFGGRVGRNNSIKRAFVGKDGRYLYPTYNRRKAWVRENLEKGLKQLVESSGMSVD